jgi:hypothetical protein
LPLLLNDRLVVTALLSCDICLQRDTCTSNQDAAAVPNVKDINKHGSKADKDTSANAAAAEVARQIKQIAAFLLLQDL